MDTRRQGIAVFAATSVLIAIVVVIQLWLVAASVDALLSGRTGVLFPALAASLALFLVNAGLLWHALQFDHRIRDSKSDGPA